MMRFHFLFAIGLCSALAGPTALAQASEPGASSRLKIPKLHAKAERSYNVFVSLVPYEHRESVLEKQSWGGAQLGVATRPLYREDGWMAALGFSLLPDQTIAMGSRSSGVPDLRYGSNLFASAGYKYWRWYGTLGLEQTLSYQPTWQEYTVRPIPQYRVSLGFELSRQVSLELYRTDGTFQLKSNDGTLPDRTAKNEVTGVLVKLALVDTQ